jgi:hypothetical protein
MSRTSFTLSAIAALSLLLGCTQAVDNSGGPPPDGDSISYAVIGNAPACGSFEERADLITDETSIDAWLERCEASSETAREDLIAMTEDLADDESLVILAAVVGGCIGDVSVYGAYLEGDVVRPWILIADGTYGRNDIACTAEIGALIIAIAVTDERSSTSAELHVGRYNPDLPNGPTFDDQ